MWFFKHIFINWIYPFRSWLLVIWIKIKWLKGKFSFRAISEHENIWNRRKTKQANSCLYSRINLNLFPEFMWCYCLCSILGVLYQFNVKFKTNEWAEIQKVVKATNYSLLWNCSTCCACFSQFVVSIHTMLLHTNTSHSWCAAGCHFKWSKAKKRNHKKR